MSSAAISAAAAAARGGGTSDRLPPSSSPTTTLFCCPLSSPDDATYLSPLMRVVRSQLEVFEASPDDTRVRSYKKLFPASRAIRPRQIGLRCVHCARWKDGRRNGAVATACDGRGREKEEEEDEPATTTAAAAAAADPSRGKSAERTHGVRGKSYFPRTLRLVYQSVRNFQRFHMEGCPHMPRDVKEEFMKLKENKTARSKMDGGGLDRECVGARGQGNVYWEMRLKAMGLEDSEHLEDGIRYVGPRDTGMDDEDDDESRTRKEEGDDDGGATSILTLGKEVCIDLTRSAPAVIADGASPDVQVLPTEPPPKKMRCLAAAGSLPACVTSSGCLDAAASPPGRSIDGASSANAALTSENSQQKSTASSSALQQQRRGQSHFDAPALQALLERQQCNQLLRARQQQVQEHHLELQGQRQEQLLRLHEQQQQGQSMQHLARLHKLQQRNQEERMTMPQEQQEQREILLRLEQLRAEQQKQQQGQEQPEADRLRMMQQRCQDHLRILQQRCQVQSELQQKPPPREQTALSHTCSSTASGSASAPADGSEETSRRPPFQSPTQGQSHHDASLDDGGGRKNTASGLVAAAPQAEAPLPDSAPSANETMDDAAAVWGFRDQEQKPSGVTSTSTLTTAPSSASSSMRATSAAEADEESVLRERALLLRLMEARQVEQHVRERERLRERQVLQQGLLLREQLTMQERLVQRRLLEERLAQARRQQALAAAVVADTEAMLRRWDVEEAQAMEAARRRLLETEGGAADE
uniref:Uncharacterized protein n=1 Tax=Odontella aurita TaxID=265563 RepID=A0A7S4JZ10_9STRA|mmetsp:Transcript_57625/g.171905  ORF Transcript_57625/g.171905 Transcript_57625/m.171905 type:complete len:758 (+) Transcript_57625:76-2349(+)